MKIVISAVGIVEGGTLQVLRDTVRAFRRPGLEVICLVHSAALFPEHAGSGIRFIEYPGIKPSWLKRLWFEYHTCRALSRTLAPDIWLSMQDITPNTGTANLFTYCQNPSPFYRGGIKDLWFDWRFFLFTRFYRFLYQLNIKKNKAVIVQQTWIADYFIRRLGAGDVIVSRPEPGNAPLPSETSGLKHPEKVRIFYPALARTFKNFELLLDALEQLRQEDPAASGKLELALTLGPAEGRYARHLIRKYGHLSNVKFLGRLSPARVADQYRACSVVAFPSKLETWGLPITEARQHGKPILLADLPYAHETLGNYDKACFMDPDNRDECTGILRNIASGRADIFTSVTRKEADGVCRSWEALADEILKRSSN